MTNIGNILNFAQGAQALQQGNINLQRSTATLPADIAAAQARSASEQAGAQRAQQEMEERQYLQKTMQTGTDEQGKSLKNADGEWNTPALAAAISRNMPLIGQPVIQNIIKTQDDRLKLNDTLRSLGDNYRNDISGIVRSSIGTDDGPQDIAAKLDAYAKQNPNSAPSITRAKALLGNLNPQAVPQDARDKALLHLSQELQPAGTTVQEQAPKTERFTNESGNIGQIQTNPLSPVPMGQVGPVVGAGNPPRVVVPPGGVPQPYKGMGPVPNSFAASGPTPTAKDVEDFGAYSANLNNRVQISSDLIPRVQQAEEALSQIRAGGGTEGYAKFGRILQAIGAPKSLVDLVSNGNLAATQEAEKYLFQTTFSGLKQSMQGDPARVAEFNEAQKVFPDVGTDPRATQAVLNFMVDQGKRDFAEQQALKESRVSGTFNPVTWQADYQQQLRAGAVPGVPPSQVPGKTGKVVTQAGVDAYAKKHGLTAQEAGDHIRKNGFTIQ